MQDYKEAAKLRAQRLSFVKPFVDGLRITSNTLEDNKDVVYQQRSPSTLFAYYSPERRKQVVIHGPYTSAVPLRVASFLNAIKPLFSISNYGSVELETCDKRDYYIIVPNIGDILSKKARAALHSTDDAKSVAPIPGIVSLPDLLRLQKNKLVSLNNKNMAAICRLLLFKHVFCVGNNTVPHIFVRYSNLGRGAKASAKTTYHVMSHIETAFGSSGAVQWSTFATHVCQGLPKYAAQHIQEWIEEHKTHLVGILKGWRALLVDKRLVKLFRQFFDIDLTTESCVLEVFTARLVKLLE